VKSYAKIHDEASDVKSSIIKSLVKS